jgi:hypothetical protein
MRTMPIPLLSLFCHPTVSRHGGGVIRNFHMKMLRSVQGKYKGIARHTLSRAVAFPTNHAIDT